MKFITTDTETGRVRVPVYSYKEIPYFDIMMSAPESRKRRGASYLEIPCAFDIETTNIYTRNKKGRIDSDALRPYAYMYHWQMCIGYRVAFGRTWTEFVSALDLIEKQMNLSKNLRLVLYVHNLSFEMQFMRHFLNVTDSFCKSERNPLYVVHNDCIEFRCSAALSNMSLAMFCREEKARFYKLSDTFDYNKIRTPETILTEAEEGYCYNDVRGLSECIQSYMRFDTLATIPLTSTGYVRRESRNAMRKNKQNRRIFRDSSLDAAEYQAMRGAFRGGDTHAALRHVDQTLHNVASFDISSSYPACMMLNQFPVSKFIKINIDTFRKYRGRDGVCFLLHIGLRGIYCTASHMIPYIPYAKTKHCTADRVLDNGRVKKAEEVTLWVTDIDFDIILAEYSIEEIRIESVYMAMCGKLPKEYRDVIMDYFVKKTTLKGLEDAESIYLYGKSKNRLNSLYGMMAMRIDQTNTIYTGSTETGYVTSSDPLDDQLEKYYKSRNNFLPYQWGVWVTAHARARLHRMMDIIGRDLVYVDTDSVKILNVDRHRGEIDALNCKLREDAVRGGAYADDRQGVRHYMGVWEYEGSYDEFRTLGAKKYVVSKDGHCISTIAGVGKKAGQKHFDRHGIEAFRNGEVIKDSGHLVAYYNDDPIHDIEVEGVKIRTASNIALINDTYTIGITGDYRALLHELLYLRNRDY